MLWDASNILFPILIHVLGILSWMYSCTAASNINLNWIWRLNLNSLWLMDTTTLPLLLAKAVVQTWLRQGRWLLNVNNSTAGKNKCALFRIKLYYIKWIHSFNYIRFVLSYSLLASLVSCYVYTSLAEGSRSNTGHILTILIMLISSTSFQGV